MKPSSIRVDELLLWMSGVRACFPSTKRVMREVGRRKTITPERQLDILASLSIQDLRWLIIYVIEVGHPLRFVLANRFLDKTVGVIPRRYRRAVKDIREFRVPKNIKKVRQQAYGFPTENYFNAFNCLVPQRLPIESDHILRANPIFREQALAFLQTEIEFCVRTRQASRHRTTKLWEPHTLELGRG